MKKRKLKIKNLLIALIVFILLIGSGIGIYLYVTTEKEVPIQKVPEKIEEKQKEKRLSLVAVGDALIHAALYLDAQTGYNTYDFNYMFTDIKPLIENYDLKYYNQETIIGGGTPAHYPRFNSPDEIGQNLVDMGFNLVGLANNHTLDKGEEGILYSVNFWRNQKDVVVSGQSDSFENRNNIQINEKNGIKYAFISYTDTTNGLTVPQGKEYLVNVYSDEQAKIDIESIRDKVDVVIVSMHWGEEYTHTPTYRQKQEAKYLASLGVDLIIGAHPHVIMPIDYIGNTLVIYSLGNFVSGQSPLGLAKTIGLMVGIDIVLTESESETQLDVVVSDYQLLYTYCEDHIRNYKVYPFNNLTDEILNNHESIEEEYLKIVTNEVIYD